MPAKYVLAQKGSSYHWNLLATNGRVIASSETYNTRQAAMAGIRSVQKNGATDVIVTPDDLQQTRRPAAKKAVKATADAAQSVAKKAAKKVSGTASAATKPAARKTAAAKAPARKAAAKKAPAKRSAAKK